LASWVVTAGCHLSIAKTILKPANLNPSENPPPPQKKIRYFIQLVFPSAYNDQKDIIALLILKGSMDEKEL